MDVINPAIARVQVWPVSLVGTGTLLDGGLNIEIIGELIERRRINLGPEPHPFRTLNSRIFILLLNAGRTRP